MTRDEFNVWIEEPGPSGKTHYQELLAVAFERTRTSDAPLADRKGRPLDIGQAEAARVVHQAVAQGLDSHTLAALAPVKAWPWMVDAVRSHLMVARRSARRAKRAHRAWTGTFLVEQGKDGIGFHTPVPVHEEDVNTKVLVGKRGSGRIVAHDPDHNDDENGHGFIGPRGAWLGEYTVAHLGPCGACGSHGRFEATPHTGFPTLYGFAGYTHVGQSWSRLELGRDRERLGYSKRWVVEALMAIEHAVKDTPANSLERLAGFALGCVAADSASRTVQRTFQALGCWNGHRAYTGEMP